VVAGKMCTFLGQLAQLDTPKTDSMKLLSADFCDLVDGTLVQVYGKHGKSGLNLSDPDNANLLVQNLNKSVKVLLERHAIMGKQQTLAIGAGPSNLDITGEEQQPQSNKLTSMPTKIEFNSVFRAIMKPDSGWTASSSKKVMFVFKTLFCWQMIMAESMQHYKQVQKPKPEQQQAATLGIAMGYKNAVIDLTLEPSDSEPETKVQPEHVSNLSFCVNWNMYELTAS